MGVFLPLILTSQRASLARFAGLLPEPGDLHSAVNSKLGKDRNVQVPSRLRKLSLRSRVTLLFLATGLLASLSLSAVSYVSARSYLLERRTEIVERQSFNNVHRHLN